MQIKSMIFLSIFGLSGINFASESTSIDALVAAGNAMAYISVAESTKCTS